MLEIIQLKTVTYIETKRNSENYCRNINLHKSTSKEITN